VTGHRIFGSFGPIAAALFLAAGLPVTAMAADTLVERLRAEAAASSPEDFAVTRIYTDNSGDTRHRMARFDPTQPAGARWTLLERNREAPSAKFKKRYESRDRAPPESYARVARFLAGDLVLSDETETHRIYRLERLAEGSVVFEDEDISAHLGGEIWINVAADRPFVEEVRFQVAESFKPHFLATVEEGEGIMRFGRDAAGRPILLQREFRVGGSKLFGSLDYAVSNRYRDHRFVRDTATAATTAADEAADDES